MKYRPLIFTALIILAVFAVSAYAGTNEPAAPAKGTWGDMNVLSDVSCGCSGTWNDISAVYTKGYGTWANIAGSAETIQQNGYGTWAGMNVIRPAGVNNFAVK